MVVCISRQKPAGYQKNNERSLLLQSISSVPGLKCCLWEIFRVGLVQVLLGLLDWRAGGKYGLCAQMKWNESEASVGRVLAVEVVSEWNCRSLSVLVCRLISFL
jgi:hypothetical protein